MILESCKKTKLPLIIHGGKSPLIKKKKSWNYGVIENLVNVDWGISKYTVVISHAGSYGCDESELEISILPKLNKLLSKFDNLFIDTADLDIDVLIKILETIDKERIIFGSDALYELQWISIVKLVHALKTNWSKAEERFLKITSFNPIKYILRE